MELKQWLNSKSDEIGAKIENVWVGRDIAYPKNIETYLADYMESEINILGTCEEREVFTVSDLDGYFLFHDSENFNYEETIEDVCACVGEADAPAFRKFIQEKE